MNGKHLHIFRLTITIYRPSIFPSLSTWQFGSFQAVGAGYGKLLSPSGGSKDMRWMPPPEPEVWLFGTTGGWR
jgi:hypothetical protein